MRANISRSVYHSLVGRSLAGGFVSLLIKSFKVTWQFGFGGEKHVLFAPVPVTVVMVSSQNKCQ